MKNADCSKLPQEESKAPIEEIILARCNCLIDQYLQSKIKTTSDSFGSGCRLIFIAATPVVLLVPSPRINIVALLSRHWPRSRLVSPSTAGVNFIRYRYIYTCCKLRNTSSGASDEEYRDANSRCR